MNAKNYDEFTKDLNIEFGKFIVSVDRTFQLSLNGKHCDEVVERIGEFLEQSKVKFVSFPVLDYKGNPNYIDRCSVYFWDENGCELLHVSTGIGCSAISRYWSKCYLETVHFELYNKNLIYTLYNSC